MASAMATFLAARKHPRSSIERLMSRSSTVAASVASSAAVDAEVRGRQPQTRRPRPPPPARRPREGAFSARPRRPCSVRWRSRLEGAPELPRRRMFLRALPGSAGAMERMAPEGPPLHASEQLLQHALAQPACAPRRKLQALAVPLE